VALWLGGLGSFDEQLVYSQGIGLSIWGILNGASIWFNRNTDRRSLPSGWRLAIVLVFGIVGGFLIGVFIGNWYANVPMFARSNMTPGAGIALFLMTLGVGLATTYYFYTEIRNTEMARALEASQRQAAEARLTLLQSQLEPHMLFNTLANLRALIATDPPQAIAMLDRLNDYLRATLSASRQPTHALASEFDRLRDYLALMSVRMADRLQVHFDLPDDLRTWPVPTLLLQPIVENSIKHGLTPAPEGGVITIRALQSGASLALEVIDTGVGLGGDESASALAAGFGLVQVRERLATAYGDAATLGIAPNSPQGTVVRITIPPVVA